MLNSECQILVPAYQSVDHETEQALRACEAVGFHVWRMPGFSAIDLARNHMANCALKAGYKGLFWIDADMGFNVSAVHHMTRAGLPIVTAACPQKDGSGRPCVVAHQDTSLDAALTPVEFCGTGFLFTAAKVYEDIAKFTPECRTRWGMEVPYFMPYISEDNWYLSEDFAFCHRAKRAGYQIAMDTTVKIRHFGRHAYTWNGAL